jgi:hypothetical protein
MPTWLIVLLSITVGLTASPALSWLWAWWTAYRERHRPIVHDYFHPCSGPCAIVESPSVVPDV